MRLNWSFKGTSSWADELDFIGPRIRTAPWAWALLLAGLLASGWTGVQLSQVDGDMADAQQVLKRLQRAAHQQQVQAMATSQPKAQAAGAHGLSPDAARHAAQVAQWLAYPWVSTLQQVEMAAQAQQAVMLSFNLDLSTLAAQADAVPDILVTAAIKDDDAALRWAQAQGPSAALRNRVRLATPFVTAAGSYEWRAEAAMPGWQPW